MELRELRYFLAVAKEQSISKAANILFVTQPNLSRQMQNLEKEIGQQLFIRGTRKITLTDAGQLLRKRAEEIIELYNKTENELSSPITDIKGEIHIGGGESYVMGLIAKAAQSVHNEYPGVKYHLFSGDSSEISERLDKGLVDFGIFIEPFDLSKYDFIRLPLSDTWGVLMRKTSPLAEKDYVEAQDLWDKPLIISRQTQGKNMLSKWFKKDMDTLNVVATGNLLYNMSLLVEEGLGYAVCLDKIIRTDGKSSLCFRPLYPRLVSHLDIAWKKYQVFPECTKVFLKHLRKVIEE